MQFNSVQLQTKLIAGREPAGGRLTPGGHTAVVTQRTLSASEQKSGASAPGKDRSQQQGQHGEKLAGIYKQLLLGACSSRPGVQACAHQARALLLLLLLRGPGRLGGRWEGTGRALGGRCRARFL